MSCSPAQTQYYHYYNISTAVFRSHLTNSSQRRKNTSDRTFETGRVNKENYEYVIHTLLQKNLINFI